jgi:uncharacterized membrane protein (UPF0127 family)
MASVFAVFFSLSASAMDVAVVHIKRSDKSVASFQVEVAKDIKTREKGLMFRKKLAKNAGMLFVYDRPARMAFWMKDTLIPLDLLFFTADGTLVYIHPMAKPHDLTLIGPDRDDICAVLEIAGGEAARQNIKVGQKIILKNNKNDKVCLR